LNVATDDNLISAPNLRPSSPSFLSCRGAMSNQDNQDQEHDVRERIVSLIQATGQPNKKQLTEAELQELKTVASRLDQMLNAAAEEDRQALKSAAARLDQLLADIGTGKDVTPALKRRRDSQPGES